MDNQHLFYTIRALESNDYSDLHKVWNDDSVVRFTLTSHNSDVESARKRVEKILNDPNEHAYVAVLATGEVVGIASLVQFTTNKQNHTGMIYLMIRSEYQNKGIGSAFFKKILDVADNTLNLKVIELKCHCDNTAGMKLYQKFGFETEGILRKRTMVDGVLKDLYVMSRLAPDLL